MEHVNENQLPVALKDGSLRFTIICLEIINYLIHRRDFCAAPLEIIKEIRGPYGYKTRALMHLLSIGIIDRGATSAGNCYVYYLAYSWMAFISEEKE